MLSRLDLITRENNLFEGEGKMRRKTVYVTLTILLFFVVVSSLGFAEETKSPEEITKIERVHWSGLSMPILWKKWRIFGSWRTLPRGFSLFGSPSSPYFRLNEDEQTVFRGLGRESDFSQWSVEKRERIATLRGHKEAVSSVSFSPDGTLLASGSDDNTIKLWDVESRDEVATLEGHSLEVNSVTFSPDGTLLASGSVDNTVKLWDVESRERITTLKGHTVGVNSVAFSPDGELLASGSGWVALFTNQGEIKLWDMKSRKYIATLEEHQTGVFSVDFSPGGSLLASGAADNTIKLWE